eukprot:CAMPEP_0170166800 /NCGR_PEP_ID=MMETSP0040_2-20121228/383_1 /TAXON_ID=641309 /ORGANISM="Lotharella oceanica, Strain CCMP622" /LENGTH=164 /DNA_ID=CAMNT_0010404617 /DNA_START=36 /DNA_END=530 /DNA_ORIENTATION=+
MIVVALLVLASSCSALSSTRSEPGSNGPSANVEDSDATNSRTSYGFANVCELAVGQFYCHLNPDDSFCANTLHKCVEIKDRCQGFTTDRCTEDMECCQCSFQDCPLEPEGCELLAMKCGAGDDTFDTHMEIAKASGAVKPGKIPIKINDPGFGSRIGGLPIIHS